MAKRGKRKGGDVEERTGPHRVLVVNDEEGAIELLCRLLARAGYEVARATHYEETLGQLADFRPDCVVLDLATGGIGQNLKLLDSIRGNVDERVSSARVVLVAHQSTNRMFSWQAGIDAFLLRPFHADDLLRDVAEALSRPDEERSRHRRRQLDAAQSEGRTIEPRAWETQRF
jgi:DNA-binding response OmpR family regulator